MNRADRRRSEREARRQVKRGKGRISVDREAIRRDFELETEALTDELIAELVTTRSMPEADLRAAAAQGARYYRPHGSLKFPPEVEGFD